MMWQLRNSYLLVNYFCKHQNNFQVPYQTHSLWNTQTYSLQKWLSFLGTHYQCVHVKKFSTTFPLPVAQRGRRKVTKRPPQCPQACKLSCLNNLPDQNLTTYYSLYKMPGKQKLKSCVREHRHVMILITLQGHYRFPHCAYFQFFLSEFRNTSFLLYLHMKSLEQTP